MSEMSHWRSPLRRTALSLRGSVRWRRCLQPGSIAQAANAFAVGSFAVSRRDRGLRHVRSPGRVAIVHGHDVRLNPANYVKPLVTRQKSDLADAASPPGMRFVTVKSVETQRRAVALRTHQYFV